MRNIRAQALTLVAAVLVACTAAQAARSKPIALELKLPKKSETPVVPPPTMPPVFTAAPIALVVVDARGAEDPLVVGGQRIKGEDAYFWRVEEPVVPSVTSMVTQALRGWSVTVAPDADLVLRLGIMKFYVNERSETFGSTYLGDVRFMASVADRAGTVLWTGEGNGASKRPGVDARAAMCNEALSYALVRALAQGLSSMKLDKAPPPRVVVGPPAGATAPAAGVTPPATPFVAPPIMIEPQALFDDLTKLLAGGVKEDVLVAYIEQRKLTRPLTVDEILQWKNAGIPDVAIKAATRP